MSKSQVSSATQRLVNHFARSGVARKDARRLTDEVHKWITKSGAEWAVSRLKDMKVYVLQCQAGNTDYKPGWIATHKDGSFSGPFRVISKLTLQQQLSCLNAYTTIKLKDITKAQTEKSLNGITSVWQSESTSKVVETVGELIESNPTLNEFRKIKINYKQFVPGGLTTAKPGTFEEGWVGSFVQGLYNPFVGYFLDRKYGFDSGIMFELQPAWDDMVMASPGAIHCIQERGAKARVVAMPNAALQTCLRPMHKALNVILGQISTDCTFQQEKGADFALESLRSGKSVYSVDLSSATDRFPRHVQLKVLEVLGWHEEAKLFKRASEGQWRLTESFGEKLSNEYVQYSVGQPMGLYGSFALFALTHNILLDSLCVEMGLNPVESFRVLGDDVIIANDQLNLAYRNLLTLIEVPVSESKTLESDKMAEFAGFIIHKELGCFKPPKVPSLDGRNFLAYVAAFGQDAIQDLPARVRKTAQVVSELPTELGGLGLNPNGKPLEQRLEPLTFKDSSIDINRFTPFANKLLEAYIRYESNGQKAECEVVLFLYDQYKDCINSSMVNTIRDSSEDASALKLMSLVKDLTYQGSAHMMEVYDQAFNLRVDKYHPSNARVWDSSLETKRCNQSHLSDLDTWQRKINISNDYDLN
jgi:hypothetical protein